MSPTTTTKAGSIDAPSTSQSSGTGEAEGAPKQPEPAKDPLGLGITPKEGVDLKYEPWAGLPRWVSKKGRFETMDPREARTWLLAENAKHLK